MIITRGPQQETKKLLAYPTSYRYWIRATVECSPHVEQAYRVCASTIARYHSILAALSRNQNSFCFLSGQGVMLRPYPRRRYAGQRKRFNALPAPSVNQFQMQLWSHVGKWAAQKRICSSCVPNPIAIGSGATLECSPHASSICRTDILLITEPN
ncbi:uncharacterized protein LAESUDRAFT_250056 [Laetiporus sulphureus 93-53]|uniref:Uncharacterized protein n=1 Tax=Laetiporus sulphureus 93-53 TaxID=1314785 RepID=A0A165DJ30_9APHY|nr:uncharacterized protein LAESUDRAFT_250056 [Laetiporus sulphureus 93-53]KZT04994.1 hypothetical protein LAESUDRAFT_250056 [Laetiporus sulphureus 93-53]